MSITATASRTAPLPSYAEDRFVVLTDPPPGTIVELAAGSQLAVRFRRGLGASRWHVTRLPGHLLALAEGAHDFQFLVFGAEDRPGPVRFERRHPERDVAHEVCELMVVPVREAGRRTPSPASPRTA